MNCRGVEEQDILERYLMGRLTDAERDEFEQHFFECDSCFSQLQTGLALRKELSEHPPVHVRAGGALFRRIWVWTPAFAALALVLAAGIWWYAAGRVPSAKQAQSSTPVANSHASRQTQQPSTPAPQLEELARVEPPPYSAVVLRGAEDATEENFRKAMQLYLKHNYAGAIPGLRSATIASPDTPRFQFYLGACYLLTNHANAAIEPFRRTISLDNPTYSELAHFYLAKAYLQIKDVPSAEQELQNTVQLGGSKAAEAKEMVHQLGR